MVLPPGPRANSLLICKPPSLGLHKHISGAASCKHSASTIEAAHWPFPCELCLPTSDKHNIKVFFPLHSTRGKDLSCTHLVWEQGWDEITEHSSVLSKVFLLHRVISPRHDVCEVLAGDAVLGSDHVVVFLILEINPLFLSVNVLGLMSCSLLEASVASLADTSYCHCTSSFLFIFFLFVFIFHSE